MIHRAMAFAMGNQDDFAKAIAALKAYDLSLVDIYSKYMSEEASKIEQLMSAETWYNVDEAIASGLATGRVENGKKYKKPKNAFDSAAALLARQKMAQYAQHLTTGKR
jgi:ATP-dependent Clp protease protease subunit